MIDVTNFSPKTDYQGSRQNLHLVERWTRTGATSLEYVVMAEDPTVWTRPWTAKQEFTRQSDADNRLYYEPRCIEGNYGLPGIMHGRRMEERAFAEGRGPDPLTRDAMKGGFIFDDDLFPFTAGQKERAISQPFFTSTSSKAPAPAGGGPWRAGVGPCVRYRARYRHVK